LPSLKRALLALENYAGLFAARAEAAAVAAGERTRLGARGGGGAADEWSDDDGYDDDGYADREAASSGGSSRSGGSSGSEGGGSDDEKDGEDEQEGEEEGDAPPGGESEATFHGGEGGGEGDGGLNGAWHVVLEGLELGDVDAAELVRAPFQVGAVVSAKRLDTPPVSVALRGLSCNTGTGAELAEESLQVSCVVCAVSAASQVARTRTL
jgi:hypothetical protein